MSQSNPASFRDSFTPGELTLFDVREVLFSGRSEYQEILVLDLMSQGRTLVLDGEIQSTERDEYMYHEALTHPAMLLVDDPGALDVLILGGGEGASLREVLRYDRVRRAVMVDLDELVVDACRRYLPCHHAGAFDDPRAEVVHQDAERYLRDHDDRFDVIVFDIIDPAETGPAAHLFEPPFLELLRGRLAPGGRLAMQYGPIFGVHVEKGLRVIRTVRSVFPGVLPGRVFVPSFHGAWGILLAAEQELEITPELLDRRIEDRLRRPLRSLDGAAIRALLTLPAEVRRAIGS